VNTDAPWPTLDEASVRVLGIQTKLHQWAGDDGGRRFDDLFNLVADPAFLTVAWDRVRGNRGARSAGVDGVKPRSIVTGEEAFLRRLRDDLKAATFVPLPVRQRMIPKANGKLRSPGIPTASGSGGASQPEAGPRTHLRDGLPPVQLRVPSRSPTA
jgi:RNA-directed DNA polymerase